MTTPPVRNSPRIVVLYGGIGSERSVSLVSGEAVLRELSNGFPFAFFGIDLKEPCLPDSLDSKHDVVLLVLHGEFGEDGQIQQRLETAGINYAGCDARCSALCMDKAETKVCWAEAGLPVVPGVVLRPQSWIPSEAVAQANRLGSEWVVKPVGMGSSVGLRWIEGTDALQGFLDEPGVQSQSWLLERRIHGREFSVGVLNGRALAVVEIAVPHGRVYDFEQKYQREDTQYVCPADLNGAQVHHVRRLAEQAFVACGCRDYARVDFLYETAVDRWFALEMNTLPGMTPRSLLPKSAAAQGYDFSELLVQMVAPAVARFREQQQPQWDASNNETTQA